MRAAPRWMVLTGRDVLMCGNVERGQQRSDGRVLRTSDLDYELPEESIATRAVEPRDAAKLMVLSRADATRLEHRFVRDLPELLRPGDLLVLNATRVLPARFRGVRLDTGGAAEGLYLGPGPGEGTWRLLIKMRRMAPGVIVALRDRAGEDAGVRVTLVERDAAEGGWIARVESDAGGDVLDRVGLTPLPPYILSARKRGGLDVSDEEDRGRYQTVYAGDTAQAGSVAAPTAGLHFTPELLTRLRDRGVEFAHVTLHVGTGTFKPVESEFVEQHPMHAEWCRVPRAAAEAIAAAKRSGGSRRVIAVGTTSARTLESFASVDDLLEWGQQGIETRILITPGYSWTFVDGLMTNFHLPQSTLMAMVAALLGGDGVARLKRAYAEALREKYRFYSYGDASLILP